MTILTLTPDERGIAIAIVALGSASGATLASFIHLVRRGGPADFLPTYVTTMALIIAVSTMLLGIPTFGATSPGGLAWAAAAGVLACAAAQVGESWLAGRMRRSATIGRARRLPTNMRLIRPDLDETPRLGGAHVLIWLILVGAGEEMLFRGILVDLVRQTVGDPLIQHVLLGLTVVAFALSHAELSLREAVFKLPLGLACLLAALASGSLLAPIAAHAGYNALKWRRANIDFASRGGVGESTQ